MHFDGRADRRKCDAAVVVIIDVLRATSVIACALGNGATEIVPVAEVEAARTLARAAAERPLLGGEAGNLKIEGFDLGNSPQEYDPQRVGGRSIILRTTNGTRALAAYRDAPALWCAAFANAGAVINALAASSAVSAQLVCAGQEGAFSLEDFLCAGVLVDGLAALRDVQPDDGAVSARELFRANHDGVAALIAQGSHARALAAAGFEGDIAFAAQIDRHSVLPVLDGSRIVSAPDTT